MSDMGKLTQQDLDFLAQVGFPCYADTAVPETSLIAEAPESTAHTPEQVVWETSPEERAHSGGLHCLHGQFDRLSQGTSGGAAWLR